MPQVADAYDEIKSAVVAQLQAVNFDAVSFQGLATVSTPTAVGVGSSDTSWIGQRLRILSGTGSGYVGSVVALVHIAGPTSPIILEVDQPWLAQPDTSSQIEIAWPGPTVYSQIDADSDTANIDYPCIVLTTAGLRRRLLPGDSRLRQYEYPVGFLLLDRPGAMAKAHEKERLYNTWLKQIDDAIYQRRLSSLAVVDTRIEPWDTFEQRPPKFEYVRSRGVIWCEVFDDRN